MLVLISLPYAPVSYDVNHSSLTPYFTTLLTLLTMAYGVYDSSFPLAKTVLQ